MTYFNWPVIETTVFAEMPVALRRPVPTEWSRANKGGAPVDCFLEFDSVSKPLSEFLFF